MSDTATVRAFLSDNLRVDARDARVAFERIIAGRAGGDRRERIAVECLAGMTGAAVTLTDIHGGIIDTTFAARWAVEFADALIAELAKEAP